MRDEAVETTHAPREAEGDTRHDTFVSAVVCVRPSDTNVASFIEMLDAELSRLYVAHEIVCVVDDEDEEVLATIRGFKGTHPEATISLVHMSFDQGIEASLSAGVDLAIGDYVYEFESCYQDFPASELERLFDMSVKGSYDVVAACPPKSATSPSSRLFYRVFNRFSGLGETLGTERFRLVSRRAINRAASFGRTIPYRKALYVVSGLRCCSTSFEPVQAEGRLARDRHDRGNTAADALIVFTDVAFKLSVFFAVLMAVAMIAVLVYVCIVYFGQHRPVEGWAPIMGVISVGLFAIFTIFAVVIKYLDVIVKLVFRRQRYLVAGIERL